jgi:hypothetical protein
MSSAINDYNSQLVTVKTTEDVKVGLKALVTGASVILEMTTGGRRLYSMLYLSNI